MAVALTISNALSNAFGAINFSEHMSSVAGFVGLNFISVGLNYLVLKLTSKPQFVALGKIVASSITDSAKFRYNTQIAGGATLKDSATRTILAY